MSAKMDGFGIAAIGIGGIFVWGGIKGYSPLKAAENVINGRNPNESQGYSTLASQSGNPNGGGTNSAGGSISANKAIAQSLLSSFGWPASEFGPLDTLWTGESGWRIDATNPTSGAYGIPQSLPPAKMASAGADWKTNASTQIKWGMGYIKATYGSPSNALAAWQSRSPHWY